MDLSINDPRESNETFIRINADFTEMYLYTTDKDIQKQLDKLVKEKIISPGKIGKKEMQSYIIKDYKVNSKTKLSRLDGFLTIWLALERKILNWD